MSSKEQKGHGVEILRGSKSYKQIGRGGLREGKRDARVIGDSGSSRETHRHSRSSKLCGAATSGSSFAALLVRVFLRKELCRHRAQLFGHVLLMKLQQFQIGRAHV